MTHSDGDRPSSGTPIGASEPRSTASLFERRHRSFWPSFRLDVVVAVFVGGCVGGYARYAAVSVWPTPSGAFPWSTFWVNIAGAFILALIVIIAAEVAPSRYLRPLIGTGFCGALTTFSSVVVVVDQLFAHHHARTAIAYLLGTIVAGLAASLLGLVVGRGVAARRQRVRHGRSPR